MESREGAEAWRRWQAWRYVLHALEELAPEALEDLAHLVPLYQEAAPHMGRPGWYAYDWEGLEEALELLELLADAPGYEESLARLRGFREALLAWGRRWNLAHPEPLSWAMENLRMWAQAPDSAGKPMVYTGPLVDIPPPPPFRHPEFMPPVYGTKRWSWPEMERRLRQAFESWLSEYRALYEEWDLPRRELLKHARWWVLYRVKRWSLRTMAKRARQEGLVDKEGRVLVEEAAPSAIAKAIASLDKALGLAPT